MLLRVPGFKAARPEFTAFDTAKFQQLTGITPRPWQEALEEYLRGKFARQPSSLAERRNRGARASRPCLLWEFPSVRTGETPALPSQNEAALSDVRSAIAFHFETFGAAALASAEDDPVLEAFVAETAVPA